MVEMTETARILNTATPQSLVILDEIGRGTSTYDGLSLAWASSSTCTTRSAAARCSPRTTTSSPISKINCPASRNFNVAVKEWDDQVVFLHQIVPGAADKSYGIHVAQLAGVPRRSTSVLAKCCSCSNRNTNPPMLRRSRRNAIPQKSLPLHPMAMLPSEPANGS